MLRISCVDGSVGRRYSRRECLRIGGLAGLGLTFGSDLWPARAASRSESSPHVGFGKARSVVILHASGGQSQLETWDPKPDAPEEIRGAFGSIPTAVPGVRLCEHLPRLAKIADRFTILRSMSHEDTDHGSAIYLSLTGQYHQRKSSNPPPTPTDLPCLGAILKRVRPVRDFPYTSIELNGPVEVPVLVSPGQFAGFLGRENEPLILGDVTSRAAAVEGLEALPEVTAQRLEDRRALLAAIDAKCERMQGNRAALDLDVQYRRAYEVLSSAKCREAFDLDKEPAKVREAYGKCRSGQSCLLARRLVEAGVPLVTVMLNHTIRGQDTDPEVTERYGWDTHNDIFDALKTHLLPSFDQTVSTFLDDLERRGLLDQTLVVCMGEFGRAPKVALEKGFAGSSPGRKHWASVYSVMFAGAGVRRGSVVGASDQLAALPKTTPFGPWDVAATVFAALGIDPAGHYHDLANRPYQISTGTPIAELYR